MIVRYFWQSVTKIALMAMATDCLQFQEHFLINARIKEISGGDIQEQLDLGTIQVTNTR